MVLTRRQFLKRSGMMAAAGMLGPRLFGNPLVSQAFADIGDKYLVVIFLDGGNDGLNTVVPASNGSGTLRNDYLNARHAGGGGLQLSLADLTDTVVGQDPNTGADIALHPGFRSFSQTTGDPGALGLFHPMFAGKVAVIQGCGYPDYSLSHEESRNIWESGDPTSGGYAGSGWIGRHLAANYGGIDIPAVNIADSIVGEFKQSTTSVLALRRLREFGFPYDEGTAGYLGVENDAKRTAFLDLHQVAGPASTLQYVRGTGEVTLLSSEQFPEVAKAYANDSNRQPFEQEYADFDRSTARDLREVAKVIYGIEQTNLLSPNAQPHFFQVSNGGYDTHSDQGAGDANGQHFGLHAEVAGAVNVFLRDLADMKPGLEDRVLVVIWSEFSRRIEQNENGTDHGSQGPMLVVGGAVNGGVYGNHPNIAESAWDDQGNTEYRQDATPFRSTDFRDVYGTILKHWLGLSQGVIIPAILQLDPGAAQYYWTTPNFDLGFLP
jgi:uncharacterized protein (DUF1501 family)